MTTFECDGDRSIHLVGWGASHGPLHYGNDEICQMFGLPPEFAAEIELMLGTQSRHSCVDLKEKRQLVAASSMAHEAARRALAQADLDAGEVQAIVAVGTIPDYYCPSTSVRVQKLLGLSGGLTFDLTGGCGAWAQGMLLAANLLKAKQAETVLLVASEPLTRLLWMARRAWELFVFGDGAAAMLLSTRHSGPFVLRKCSLDTAADLDGCRDEIMTIPIVGDVLPPLLARSDHLDPLLPDVNYPDEYRGIHRAGLAARWGARLMSTAVEQISVGIDRSELYLCPHQPGRAVIDAVQEQLALETSQLALINPTFGNLSSASSPSAFCERFEEGPAKYPWTVLAPIGTGLTYGAALFENVGAGPDRPDRHDRRHVLSENTAPAT